MQLVRVSECRLDLTYRGGHFGCIGYGNFSLAYWGPASGVFIGFTPNLVYTFARTWDWFRWDDGEVSVMSRSISLLVASTLLVWPMAMQARIMVSSECKDDRSTTKLGMLPPTDMRSMKMERWCTGSHVSDDQPTACEPFLTMSKSLSALTYFGPARCKNNRIHLKFALLTATDVGSMKT